MTQPKVILATIYCTISRTPLVVFPFFLARGVCGGGGFSKQYLPLTSFLKNDLYVNSPFSQILDDGTKKKITSQEAECNASVFFPLFNIQM